MELANVEKLKQGDRVKCRLDGYYEYNRWFNATIKTNKDRDWSGRIHLLMTRDDSFTGLSWVVRVDETNNNLIQMETQEWDYEVNE